MSFLKARWWKPATALVILALAAGALTLTGGTAHAGETDGSVTLDPADLQISAGGSGQVSVDLTPASAGTSIWIIQVAYDPTVAQVEMDNSGNPVCTPLSVPGDFAGAAGCDVKDTNSDTVPDTLVVFGGGVKNDNGTPVGFTTEQTVATFTFDAVGAAGAHTDLTTSVTSFLGPNGETPTAAASNGAIDITASQGTSRIWGDVDCSGAPVDIGDAIDVERSIVSLSVNKPAGCPSIGDSVTVNGTPQIWGDVDCSGGSADIGDAIDIERSIVSLSVSKPAGCPAIGDTVQVS